MGERDTHTASETERVTERVHICKRATETVQCIRACIFGTRNGFFFKFWCKPAGKRIRAQLCCVWSLRCQNIGVIWYSIIHRKFSRPTYLQGKGLEPDLVTYSTLIKAYERAGEWERSLEVMQVCKMWEFSMYYAVCCIYILTAYARKTVDAEQENHS